MAHHDNDENHHRQFPSCESWVGDGDGDGPTCSSSPIYNDAYDVISGGSGAAETRAGTVVRAVQPFDISSTTPPQTASKSPAGRMATSLGFPFTTAQWKELERQAMVYKYMMASVPVPPELLTPTARPSSDPVASHSSLGSSVLNLRLSSSTDPEPGRCKRTDGKKWRCSRDVAPDHKYCERHLHRGRPRSRKPVEGHGPSDNIKRSRREDFQAIPNAPVSVAIPNPSFSNSGFSSQFLGSTTGQPYQQPTVSAQSHKEPRCLDWRLKGEPVPVATTGQQWQSLMQNKMEFSYPSYSNAESSVFKQSYFEDSQNLNSYSYFSPFEDPQNKDFSLLLNSDMVSKQEPNAGTTRAFIDAWSEENIANSSNICSVSSDGLSPSSLTLSMGGSNSIDEEMGHIHMGLGQIESDGNNGNGNKSHLSSWLTPTSVASAPGGPLAEVLMPSTAASDPSSTIAGNRDSSSSPAIMALSPSGVLQKTFTSFSDSSDNSSPALGNSGGNPEISLPWLN